MLNPDRPKASAGLQQGHAASCILYVIGSLDLGGSERHLAVVTPGLRRRGFRPLIYCLSHRGAQADQLEKDGVEIAGPWLACNEGPNWRKRTCLALSALRLFGLMLTRRPRFVHFFLPMSYVIGAPLAILAGLPRRVMSRRSLNLYQRKHRFYAWLERGLHNRMSAVLGNSRAVTDELAAEGCERRRIGLIYNGVDPAPIDSAPASSATRPLTLLVVANLIPYKGHADLLRALAGIADRMPPDWTLLCAGRDDGIGGSLRQLADELGAADHIQWLGERRDVAALLKSSDIGILCSHEEGFSNAVLEGMAAGLPMVVTDVGGNAEAVAGGVGGIVVPPHDPTALGEAILILANDPALRAKMGRAARERIERHFAIDRCLNHYENLYRDLESGRIPADISIDSQP